MPVKVYLGLGSNQGDRALILSKAVEDLAELGQITAQSSLLETKPFGFVSTHLFLNAVVCLETELSPWELLKETQSIERELGRLHKSKNGIYSDRPIDIDILFYGREVVEENKLTIPHKELHKRLFVLEPLMKLAPNLQHPILKQSVRELYEALKHYEALSKKDSNF